jgi:hypothetical protein
VEVLRAHVEDVGARFEVHHPAVGARLDEAARPIESELLVELDLDVRFDRKPDRHTPFPFIEEIHLFAEG